MTKKSKLNIGIAKFITTLLILCSFFPAVWQGEAAYAQEGYNISAVATQNDREVTVTVSLTNNNPQLDGLQFNLDYDKDAFSLKDVNDKKLIAENSIFSATKEYDPYFCSWYVGTDTKPDSSVANGELVSFVFDINETAGDGTYSFAVKDISGFYYTESEEGQIVKNSVNLSTVRAQVSIVTDETQVLHTYDEAKALLEQEADNAIDATGTAKWDALDKYDADAMGYSIEAAEIVYQKIYEDALAEIDACLQQQLTELENAENEKVASGQGGTQSHNITASLKAIQAKSKTESDFTKNATTEALQTADNSLKVSLDGERIITATIGTDLTSNYTSSSNDETIYFSLTIPEDGAYGFDIVYKSEEEYNSFDENVVELEGLYKNFGDSYRIVEYESMGTGNYIDEKYTIRRWVYPYESLKQKEILSAGDTYIFAITLKGGFRPQELKLMSYDYADIDVIAGDGGIIAYLDDYTSQIQRGDDLIIVDYVTGYSSIAIPFDGYVFDGYYIGDTEVKTQYGRDYYWCYSFRDENGETVAPEEFWNMGGDIYFSEVDGKIVAELRVNQLKSAGLEGIECEYSDDGRTCEFTLEALMKKIGATKYIIKNYVWDESFDESTEGITKRTLNTITAKFIPMVYGDADRSGKVEFADALYLKRCLAGWEGYEGVNNIANDLNNDGEFTVADITILERHLAGWKGYETLPKTN